MLFEYNIQPVRKKNAIKNKNRNQGKRKIDFRNVTIIKR